MTLNDTREILNGVLAVSAFCVFLLLVTFLMVRRIGQQNWAWRWRQKGWWRDSGVQVAGALAVLVLGHFLRFLPQWIQFIALNARPEFDMTSSVYMWATITIIPATALILLGKILSVWSIAPGEWSWHIASVVLLLSCGVPLLVYWFI